MTSYDGLGQRPGIPGETGAASENRTPDLLITSETLHQGSPPDSLVVDALSVSDVSDYVSDSLEKPADLDASDGARTRLWATMNTEAERETPAFTGIHNPSSTVRSASEPLAVPSGDDQPASATADVLLTHFEQTMTMGEALANGLYVAEHGGWDDLMRCYGRTPDEAGARLLNQLAAGVWLIDPSGTATKADGTVLHR